MTLSAIIYPGEEADVLIAQNPETGTTTQGKSVQEALDNLRVVSQDLRELMGQVKRYPSQALFGEAPPKKAVNK